MVSQHGGGTSFAPHSTENVDIFDISPDGGDVNVYDDENGGFDLGDDSGPDDPIDSQEQHVSFNAKPMPLTFSKKAKRVDVQKLKENIWGQMEGHDIGSSFSSLITGLDSAYSPVLRKDVSVPFCFICLLHLANEKNLTLNTSSGLTELLISKN